MPIGNVDPAPCARTEGRQETGPVERGSRIGLASGRYLLMAHHRTQVQGRVSYEQCIGNVCQRGILRRRVGYVVRPLELDSYREIVAVDTSSPTRLTGVPRAFIECYVLVDGTRSIDEHVCRDPDPRQIGKLRSRTAIEGIGEQPIHEPVTELSRRQADAVYDKQ